MLNIYCVREVNDDGRLETSDGWEKKYMTKNTVTELSKFLSLSTDLTDVKAIIVFRINF